MIVTSSVDLPERQLHLEGELSVVLPSGRETRLEASGNSFRWFAGNLREVIREAGLSRGQRADLVTALDRLGATFSLFSGGQVVLSAGSGRRSLLGRLLLGSAGIRIHRPWAWIRASD